MLLSAWIAPPGRARPAQQCGVLPRQARCQSVHIPETGRHRWKCISGAHAHTSSVRYRVSEASLHFN
eukprot:scaffold164359_cov20-Prasinocladus_malaysianus.AAC.1